MVAAILYLFILNKPEAEELPLNQSAGGEVAMQTEKILENIRRVDGYVRTIHIFEDSRFTSLKDYTVEIPDVPAGRKNPFEPL